MDTTKELTAIEWCAGYGGIHLGLKRAIPSLRVIAYGEIEGFACANLVAKMEARLLDPAPLWTDIKTFPCEEFRDRVGLLVAGYPCQPFSAAGKRLGADDPRHLWPHIMRAIRVIRPRLCFFENVEGHISLGLREVLGDLGSAGYTAAWGIFSASEVGAPHQRKRVFILAYRDGERGQLPDWWREPAEQVPVGDGEARRDGSSELGYAGCHIGSAPQRRGEEGQWKSLPTQRPDFDGASPSAWPSRPGEQQFAWEPPRVVGAVPAKLANFCSRDAQQGGDTAQASGEGSGQRGEGADSNADGGSGLCGGDQGDESTPKVVANGHGRGQRECCKQDSIEIGLNQQSSQRNNACGCNEAMGNATSERPNAQRPESGRQQRATGAAGTGRKQGLRQAQPSVGGDADGPAGGMDYAELQVSCDNRTDELRLLGNGVVPATAERAFLTLMQELLKGTK